MICQSEILSRSQIIFVTLFSAGAQGSWTFHQLAQSVQLCWAKTIFLSHQTGMFSLFFIQFSSAGSNIEHRWRCSKERLGIHTNWNWARGDRERHFSGTSLQQTPSKSSSIAPCCSSFSWPPRNSSWWQSSLR
jgi:hypothetical protein